VRVSTTTSRARSSSSSATSTRFVKRNGRYVRVAPSASYQPHPDPDRYQQIQQALADKGYFKGEVNGQWGDDSVDALKRFQADQKLDDDGKLSSLTLIGLGLGPRHDGTTAKLVSNSDALPVTDATPGLISSPTVAPLPTEPEATSPR
jgi:peptidoglycan hydrolase-like protein with peptidoglycan-binding domain